MPLPKALKKRIPSASVALKPRAAGSMILTCAPLTQIHDATQGYTILAGAATGAATLAWPAASRFLKKLPTPKARLWAPLAGIELSAAYLAQGPIDPHLWMGMAAAGGAWWAWSLPRWKTWFVHHESELDKICRIWDERLAVEGTPMTRIVLRDVTLTDTGWEARLEGESGQIVPVNCAALVASHYGVPESGVTLINPETTTPHHGRIVVCERSESVNWNDPSQAWAATALGRNSAVVRTSPIPEVEGGGVVLHVETDRDAGDLPTPKKIAKALRLKSTLLVSVKETSPSTFDVMVLDRHPLQNGVPLHLNGMDEGGNVIAGRRINGTPAAYRVLEPGGGTYDMVVFGSKGSGKSQFVYALIANERASGIVHWVADMKGGQSVPFAKGNVDWFVKSHKGLLYQARAMRDEMARRMAANGKRVQKSRTGSDLVDRYGNPVTGQSFFTPLDPDPVLTWVIDEFNDWARNAVPAEKNEVLGILISLGSLSRSLGLRVVLTMQQTKATDMGNDTTLRSLIQSGVVVALRPGDPATATRMLGSRSPETGVPTIPDTFPNGKATSGMGYLVSPGADGDEFTVFRGMFTEDWYGELSSGEVPVLPIDDEELGEAYASRLEYYFLGIEEEAQFLSQFDPVDEDETDEHVLDMHRAQSVRADKSKDASEGAPRIAAIEVPSFFDVVKQVRPMPETSVREMIVWALEKGHASAGEIIEATGQDERQIRNLLSRMKAKGQVRHNEQAKTYQLEKAA